MVFTVYNLVEALWLIIPAFAANGLTPLLGLKKGLHPIDAGHELWGSRLLGPGKSWEGLAFGSLVGLLVGTVQMLTYPLLPWGLSSQPLTIVSMGPVLGLALGLGAMLGDAGASFIKRRLNRPRGSPVPLLDQLDFVFGALLLALFFVPLRLEWLLILAVLTPVLHLAANVIGFRLGIKKTPW